MKITLRKALNLKNKLVGEIAELGSKIKQYNVYEINAGNAGVAQRIDVSQLLLDYTKAKNDLITLKIAIVNANAGSDGSKSIYSDLVKIEETKALIAFLKSINTDDSSRENVNYHTNVTTVIDRKCHITYEEVQKYIKTAEKGLETLLDKIEEFNGSTKIEVNF